VLLLFLLLLPLLQARQYDIEQDHQDTHDNPTDVIRPGDGDGKPQTHLFFSRC
jgi:hypothetical protein